jgi:SAM-dependent methyltransferase
VAWRNIDIELWGCTPQGEAVALPADKEVSRQRSRRHSSERHVRFAANQVVDALRMIEGQAGHAQRTVPTAEERETVGSTFWQTVREFEVIDRRASGSERACCAAAAREVLHPWLLRSDYWSRSYLKPHGRVDDFRTLEWIYDIEGDPCADPTKPVVVNLLDYLYRTVQSVRAVWHRRRWYTELVGELLEARRARGPVRILDLACGGSRYVRDVLNSVTYDGCAELTFLDEDPAALMFIRSWLPSHLRATTRLICSPVQHLRKLILDSTSETFAGFDLVISTRLFDHLAPGPARKLLLEMSLLARPGGLVAVSNFTPDDESRIVKDWIVEWPLNYRSVSAVRDLMPAGHSVGFDRSPDGGLLHALLSVRRGGIARTPSVPRQDSTSWRSLSRAALR